MIKGLLQSPAWKIIVAIATIYGILDFIDEYQNQNIEYHDVILVISSILCLME